jgi:hypothetical protein
LPKIGFIGGCISYPIGIENDSVYHYLLKMNFPGIEISVSKYYTYSELPVVTGEFIKKESPDVLFVFLRHFPYMVLNKLLVKHSLTGKKTVRSLHPHLKDRSVRSWPSEFDLYTRETANIIPVRQYFGFRDINAILGKMAGLHQWAYQYVETTALGLKEICDHHSVKLIVIGPTKNPETFMGDRICTYLNDRIKYSLAKKNIDFIDINLYKDEENNSLFRPDKIHFNECGHRFLYRRLAEKICLLRLAEKSSDQLVYC